MLSLYYRLPYFLKCLIATIRGYILKSNRTLNRDKFLAEIKDRDTWNKKKVKDFQQELIKEMLAYCIKYVPYYRDYHNEQSKNRNWDPLVLSNWPILEKDVIRKNPDRFLSEEYKKADLVNISTSGTSGKPMSFYFSKNAQSYWYAIYEYRIKIWNGVNDNDVWANMGGQLVCEIGRSKPPYWVYNYAMNQLYMSSYHLRPENIKDYVNAITKHNVQFILGYVSSIFTLAHEAVKQNIVLPKLKVIITNAEPLLDSQREIISNAFGCHVVQTYSSSEYSFSGNENLKGDMCIWPEVGKMEVLTENGAIVDYGSGELLATGLVNKAMPLIRYRVGDTIEILKADKDYLPFDRIGQIVGRTDDLVTTSTGEKVGRLDPVFKFDLKIKEAQIVQEDYEIFTVKVVPDFDFSEKDSLTISNRLKERVGNNCEVKIVIVNEIPRSKNGKFKAVISNLKNK